MRTSDLRPLLLFLSVLFVVPAGLDAQGVSKEGPDRPASPKSVPELFKDAAVVVLGTVTGARAADDLISRLSGPPIVWVQTGYSVSVNEVFKAPGLGDIRTVEVMLEGGERDGVSYPSPPDVVAPAVGDQVIVFLTAHPNRKFSGSFVPKSGGDGIFLIRNARIQTKGRSPLSQSLRDTNRDNMLQALRALRGGK